MGWYNEEKNISENVEVFFIQNECNYTLFKKLLKDVEASKKSKEKSFESSFKENSTNKQRTRHETNCKDFEYKQRLLDYCFEKIKLDNTDFNNA